MRSPAIPKIIAACLFSALALGVRAQPFLVPHPELTNEGVEITWEMSAPCGLAEVFWTDRRPDRRQVPEDLSAFPEYTSYLRSDLIQPRQRLLIPFPETVELEKERYKGARPLIPDTVVHYRASCVVLNGQQTNIVRSRDYSFRVISSPDGNYQWGLTLVEGPTVRKVETRRVDLQWKTNSPANATVAYWPEGKDESTGGRLEVRGPRTEFRATLDDLLPNQPYRYYIILRSERLEDTLDSEFYTFHTMPEGNQPVVFAVIGASRGNPHHPDLDADLNRVNVTQFNRLLGLAYKKGAQFVLVTGEMVRSESLDREGLDLALETWRQAAAHVWGRVPIYPVMTLPADPFTTKGASGAGSEESPEAYWRGLFALPENGPTATATQPTYQGNVYDFSHGNVRIFALNSHYRPTGNDGAFSSPGPLVGEAQRTWLDERLAEASERWTFVAVNDLCYPVGNLLGKSLDAVPEARDALWRILDTRRVDVLFCGREHNYSRLSVDSRVDEKWGDKIYQINCGRAGAPGMDSNPDVPWFGNVEDFANEPHVLMVSCSGKKLSGEVLNLDGERIDSFQLRAKDKKSPPEKDHLGVFSRILKFPGEALKSLFEF
ncbi:MAG: hypothetical protein V2A74_01670 [bacterium]